MHWKNGSPRSMKTLTSSKTAVQPWNSLSHCCSKCPTSSVTEREGETTKSWVHDTEQKEQEVKPTMKHLSFNYQGYTAHAWRSRGGLWQMCLGNLHGLQKREGVTWDKKKGYMNACSEVVQKSRVAMHFPVLHLILFCNWSRLHASSSCVNKTNPELIFACANSLNWGKCEVHIKPGIRGQEFCAKALSKSDTGKKTWTEKIIWESSKCQQLLELCECLSGQLAQGVSDSVRPSGQHDCLNITSAPITSLHI